MAGALVDVLAQLRSSDVARGFKSGLAHTFVTPERVDARRVLRARVLEPTVGRAFIDVLAERIRERLRARWRERHRAGSGEPPTVVKQVSLRADALRGTDAVLARCWLPSHDRVGGQSSVAARAGLVRALIDVFAISGHAGEGTWAEGGVLEPRFARTVELAAFGCAVGVR